MSDRQIKSKFATLCQLRALTQRHPGASRLAASIFVISLFSLATDLVVPLTITDLVVTIYNPQKAFLPSAGIACAVLGALQTVRALLSVLKGRLACRFQIALLSITRVDIASQLVLNSGEVSRSSAGSVVSGLTQDLGVLETFLSSGLWEGIFQALFFIGSAGILFFLNPKLTFLAALPIPFAVLLYAKLFPRLRNAMLGQHLAQKKMAGLFQELLEGKEVIHAFRAGTKTLLRFCHFDAVFSEKNWIVGKANSLYHPLYEWVGGMAMALLFAGGSILTHRGEVSFSVMLSFVVYLGYFYRPIFSSSRIYEQWQRVGVSLDRLAEAQTRFSSLKDHRKLLAGTPTDSVQFRDVTFAYPGKPAIFENLSVGFPRHSTTGIIGPNGAGKSTFIKLLNASLAPTSGTVEVSVALGETPQVAYLPQEPFLFDDSIFENLRLCGDASDDEIFEVAKQLGIHESLLSLAHGYETQVGPRGTWLSGGQRQKVSLLRFALRAREAEYCFIDEPLSYIDIESEKALLTAIFSFCRGRTTVLVSHRAVTLKYCDSVFRLESGKLLPVSSKSLTRNPSWSQETTWQN